MFPIVRFILLTIVCLPTCQDTQVTWRLQSENDNESESH